MLFHIFHNPMYNIFWSDYYFFTGVFCFYWLYLCHLLWCWIQELNALLPVNIFQIHFYCYLHFRVSYKDICKRILCSAVLLFERSMELAGLHRHRHGVSIHISDIFTRFLAKDYLSFSILGEETTARTRLFKNQRFQCFNSDVRSSRHTWMLSLL